MAAEYSQMMSNSGAAYDLYQNAAPQRLPQGLPEELPRPLQTRRVKAKPAFAPFTFFGGIAVVCMMILVIFGYVQLYEASTQAARLSTELSSLQKTQAQLLSKYESHINLPEIEKRASELGLSTPRQEQIVYINLCGEDSAEIFHEKKTGALTEVVQAVEQSVAELIAYLSPSAA